MQGSRLLQEDAVQAHSDSSSLEQGGSVQQVDTKPARMDNLLAKLPNLALLAAAFFASLPIDAPDIFGHGH